MTRCLEHKTGLADGEAGEPRRTLMTRRRLNRNVVRTLLVLAVAASVAMLGTSHDAVASNMAFKLNKQIYALDAGGKGRNFVAFPDRGPHSGPGGFTNICNELNLSVNGTITQFNAQVGTVNTYQCGQLETFTFMDGVGALVQDTTATSGIIVGSDIPGNSFTFYDHGTPPLGYNYFPVEYHTTAVTPEDICTQCGLTSGASTVTRFDAQQGLVLTHQCGQLPLWNLVLGEAVLILEENGPKTCVPPHF